ncbi:uncharacterized protein LOC143372661 [Andrena cerasifolii]|uniref:uncharacterized protein LOC143372661 n=1 Tax=Andrena cerasifolii TaxID=2819439 RepID=UPI004037611C
MRLNAIRPLFWAVQLFNLCAVAPWIITVDDTCPCSRPDQCPNDSRVAFKNSQVIKLPCENEQLVRCCSSVRRPIESLIVRGSPARSKQENDIVKKYADTSLLKEETRVSEVVHAAGTSDEYSETTLQSTVPSVKESSTDARVPSLNAQLSESNDKIEVNATRDDDVDRATKSNAETLQSAKSDTSVGVDQKPTLKNRQMLSKLRPMHVRVLNRGQATTQSEQSGGKKSDEFVRPEIKPFVQDEEEQLYVQGLIDEAKHFESFRTLPKESVPFPIRNSKQREEEVVAGKTDFVAPGKPILNRGNHSPAGFKLPSIPKSVPEKIGDHLERKTSLGVAVTLDEASTRATNENTSPTRRLDDDTLVRHLLHPEDEENIKRVARSHGLETDSNDLSDFSKSMSRTSSPIADDETTGVGAIRRFKRPPRILPMRNLQSQESDSSKYASSKERAKSLFQKSNETRRKHVSFIINRNESNAKKLNSSDSDLPSMGKVENDDRIMQVETTRLR